MIDVWPSERNYVSKQAMRVMKSFVQVSVNNGLVMPTEDLENL
jgi:hypothetical protein